MGPAPPPSEEVEEEDTETCFGVDCDPDASESSGSDAEELEAFEVPESCEVLNEASKLPKLAAQPQRAGPPLPTPVRSDALAKRTFVASHDPTNAGTGLLYLEYKHEKHAKLKTCSMQQLDWEAIHA